jgi:lipopolysaccharide transport system permease protein
VHPRRERHGYFGRHEARERVGRAALKTTVASPARPSDPTLVLRPGWTSPAALGRELLRSTELCLTLARKDFFVRYRRAALGIVWAIALPALQAVVLAVILSRVARIHVDHYAVFILSGIVAWTYFGSTLGTASTSIVDNSSLSSRIYFPRAVLPISTCLSNLFAMLISFAITVLVAVATGVVPGPELLYIVPGIVLTFLLTVAMTLVLSALHVYFRDVKYAVQAGLLVWFYVTPVFYPVTLLHGFARRAVEANPVSGCIELFQTAVLGGRVSGLSVSYTIAWTAVLLVAAVFLHCRHDRTFADLL